MAQTLTRYESTDGSAPTLSGTQGDLLTVLDAVLVNGYGSQAAAGWAIAFTAANKRVYRSSVGNRLYFRLDEANAATAKECRIRGYEVMTDVDTGTGLFPTAAQATNGQFIRKSNTADATTRSWIILADNRTCYIFVDTGDTANVWYAAAFGELYSLLSGDAYNSFVCARGTENNQLTSAGNLDMTARTVTSATNFYVARSISQTGTCISCGRHGDNAYMWNGWNAGSLTYPNIDGSVLASRMWVTEIASGGIRGFMRGFWNFLHPGNSVPNRSTATGTGELAGRTYLFLQNGELGYWNSNTSVYMMETSNTVETN